MSKVRTLAVVFMLALLLSGCGLQKGYVYNKRHTAAYTTISSQVSCSGSGKRRTCHSHPVMIHHPEAYWLDIQSCPIDQPRTQDCETNSIQVSASTYTQTQIGDWVDFTGH